MNNKITDLQLEVTERFAEIQKMYEINTHEEIIHAHDNLLKDMHRKVKIEDIESDIDLKRSKSIIMTRMAEAQLLLGEQTKNNELIEIAKSNIDNVIKLNKDDTVRKIWHIAEERIKESIKQNGNY
jgi:hypothetical protein